MSNKKNKDLKQLAELMRKTPELEDFANYCDLREKGLRKQAFAALDKFIAKFADWEISEKRKFVDWLLNVQLNFRYGRVPGLGIEASDVHQLITHPLLEKVITPVLKQWEEDESNNYLPLRWLGYLDIYYQDDELGKGYIERALELNPDDEISQYYYVDRRLNDIEFALHHLPDYYIGDSPEEDLTCSEDLAKWIDDYVKNEEMKKYFMDDLNACIRQLKDMS